MGGVHIGSHETSLEVKDTVELPGVGRKYHFKVEQGMAGRRGKANMAKHGVWKQGCDKAYVWAVNCSWIWDSLPGTLEVIEGLLKT